VTAGTGLQGGGDLSADRTLSLPAVGTPGTYGDATHWPAVTTDAQGRVTGVTTQAAPGGTVTGVTASPPLASSGGAAPNLTLGTVTVPSGGTGQTTLAAHGVLVGAGAAAVAATGAGTAGQVLTSGGPAADPAFAALPTASSGSVALDAPFAITAANGVYQAVRTTTPAADLAVALPAAGTYLLTMVTLAGLQYSSVNASGWINGRLYNVTDAAAVPNTTMLCLIVYGQNVTAQLTTSQSVVLTVAAPKTIRLEALRDGATTWVASGINPNNTTLTYVRLY
jgi:hypothetical protein